MKYRVFAPLLVVTTILFLFFTPVLHVKCTIGNNDCPPELQQKIAVLKGSSFFFGNFEKKLEQNRFSESIYILETIKKIFPNTVWVTLKQEQVAYTLTINGQKNFIGKSGVIVPSSETNDMHFVQFDWNTEKSIVSENTVSANYHQKILNVAQILKEKPIENARFSWNSDQEIQLFIPNQPIFIFDTDTIETQVKKVDTIINAKELEEIAEPILEVDMRFDLPVLRTSR